MGAKSAGSKIETQDGGDYIKGGQKNVRETKKHVVKYIYVLIPNKTVYIQILTITKTSALWF